jgi:light-regulated signal transduction histidine kinase (bacteriophytochrome)
MLDVTGQDFNDFQGMVAFSVSRNIKQHVIFMLKELIQKINYNLGGVY